MPIVQVNLMQGRTDAQKKAAAVAITDAVVETLGVKRESVRVLFHEVGTNDFYAGGITIAERNAMLAAQAEEK